ncbi:hypothetical protein CXG81DRAFT_28914, partial [Caulochytrium protostelioides]
MIQKIPEVVIPAAPSASASASASVHGAPVLATPTPPPSQLPPPADAVEAATMIRFTVLNQPDADSQASEEQDPTEVQLETILDAYHAAVGRVAAGDAGEARQILARLVRHPLLSDDALRADDAAVWSRSRRHTAYYAVHANYGRLLAADGGRSDAQALVYLAKAAAIDPDSAALRADLGRLCLRLAAACRPARPRDAAVDAVVDAHGEPDGDAAPVTADAWWSHLLRASDYFEQALDRSAALSARLPLMKQLALLRFYGGDLDGARAMLAAVHAHHPA